MNLLVLGRTDHPPPYYSSLFSASFWQINSRRSLLLSKRLAFAFICPFLHSIDCQTSSSSKRFFAASVEGLSVFRFLPVRATKPSVCPSSGFLPVPATKPSVCQSSVFARSCDQVQGPSVFWFFNPTCPISH